MEIADIVVAIKELQKAFVKEASADVKVQAATQIVLSLIETNSEADIKNTDLSMASSLMDKAISLRNSLGD